MRAVTTGELAAIFRDIADRIDRIDHLAARTPRPDGVARRAPPLRLSPDDTPAEEADS